MAGELDLLFKLKAQNETAAAFKGVQADVSRLKTSFGADFKQMQSVATSSLGQVTSSLTQVAGHLPVVGTAVNSLASQMGTMTTASEGAAAGMAGLAGPLGLAAVGVGLTASAVGALATELFGLAKSSAEFQGKLFDLSQQTGVNVETLSALEVVAKTTGSDIGAITASLGIFQKNLEDAQDPTSKESALLKTLGIETKNTEDALRQTLVRLAAMPEGFHQTAVALELFGRGGKSMLAILKEMHGDLDGAIKRFREMGILISDADAKAADEFNDQLALLQFQLRSLGAVIGKEIVPVALEAIKDLSKALHDNKDAINAVATAAGLLSNLFTGPLKGAIFVAEGAWLQLKPTLEGIADLYERIGAAAQLISGRIPNVSSNAIPALPSGSLTPSEVGASVAFGAGITRAKGKGGKGGLTEEQKDAQARLKILEVAAQDASRIFAFETQALQTNFDQRKLSLRDYTNAVIEEAGKELAAKQGVTDEERKQAALLPVREKKLELARISLKEQQDQDAFVLTTLKAQEARRKTEEAAETDHRRALLQLGETYDAAELERIQRLVEGDYISHFDGQKKIEVIQKAAFERRQDELLRLLRLVKGNQEEEDKITDELNQNSADRAAQEQENVRLTTEALQKGVDAYREYKEAIADVAREIAELNREVAQTAIDKAREAISHQFFNRDEAVRLITEEAKLRQDALTDFYAKRKATINAAEAAERAKHIGNEEKLLEIDRAYDALRLADERKFQSDSAEIERLAAEARAHEKNKPIFGGIEITPRDELGNVIEDATAAQEAMAGLNAALIDSANLGKEAFGALAQGVGSLVDQYVLLGTTGPNALRKLLAAVLAHLAAEAAVKAIFQLAEGFAALFINPAEAAAHFTAAGIYGSIAGVAAGAGRALAGDLFKQKPGALGDRSSSPQGALQTINTGRNQPQVITIHFKGDDSKLASFITHEVVTNFNDGGQIREVIANDGR